jgi:2-hydroxychromene-2-carboxylate isomerase
MGAPTEVEFFFDPMCPWAYQTSKWIRTVRTSTGLDVRWRFFSLEEVNRVEGKKHPWERDWSYGWSLMRVGAWLRREDPELLDRWYAAIGSALHERGEQPHRPEVAAGLVTGLGLPGSSVAEAVADPTTTDEVRADHEWLVSTHGGFGVPTLVFGDHALFGPVVTPAPEGDAALRLWDLVTGWVEFPHLYELRKPKTAGDQAHIEDQFRPYLGAREWRTIQNPAP